nr:hypothetical protein [uncultured Roseovarius sp.]
MLRQFAVQRAFSIAMASFWDCGTTSPKPGLAGPESVIFKLCLKVLSKFLTIQMSTPAGFTIQASAKMRHTTACGT